MQNNFGQNGICKKISGIGNEYAHSIMFTELGRRIT
jgi:hypothetical protein